MPWTVDAFERASHETRISQRTLDACRLVLVDDLTGVDASEKTGVSTTQISRAVKTLREKYAEFGEISAPVFEEKLNQFRSETLASKAVAINDARSLFGEALVISDALPEERYVGTVLLKTPCHVVQGIGPGEAVIHEVSRLGAVPSVKDFVVVQYPADTNRLAQVVIGDQRGSGRGVGGR